MQTLVGRRVRPALTVTACLYLTLVACSGSAVRDAQQTQQAVPEPVSVERRGEILDGRAAQPTPATTAPPEPESAAAAAEVPQLFVALFKEDLTLRALVKQEAISVLAATPIEWPDGSLGCGRPGQAYTQAVVRGYRVVLSANGTAYAYHSDLRGNFVVCQQGRALPPLAGQLQSPLEH